MNSSHTMMVDDVESGNLGPYRERPRTFPSMRSKSYAPWIFRVIMGINVRVLIILLVLGLGAIVYMGASTSPIIVFVFTVCIISFLLSVYLTKWVLSKDEGPPEMVEVIYMEACESGSMFQGILPSNMSTYAVTAANAVESSWAAYCSDGSFPPPPPDFPYNCLGDVFSISWLEDADSHDLTEETLSQQYSVVRRRTGFDYGTDTHQKPYL